jgi:hypothetical protein
MTDDSGPFALVLLGCHRVEDPVGEEFHAVTQQGIVKLSEVGAVANHISLMRHI